MSHDDSSETLRSRLSYSKPRQEVLNEDIHHVLALFPISLYAERSNRAEVYGFNEALKQDIPIRNTVSGEQYGPRGATPRVAIP